MVRAPSETHESLWWLVFAPLVWATHFLLSYVTGAIACAKFADPQDDVIAASVLVAVYTVVALALIGGAATIHRHRHRRGAAATTSAESDGRADRHRFLGLTGVLLCCLSAIAVIYTAVVSLLIGSCL